MKLSKSKTIIMVVVLVLIGSLTLGYFYNRAVTNLEKTMIARVRADMEAKAKAEREVDRQKFADEKVKWNETIALAGEAYSKKNIEAANERRAKEAARRANESLNADWQVKFENCNRAHKETILSWDLSDKFKSAAQDDLVAGFNLKIAGMEKRILGLDKSVEDGSKELFDVKEKLALSLWKLRKRIVHGPVGLVTYRNGGPDASVGYGIMFIFGRF
jgi:hypothetical protein